MRSRAGSRTRSRRGARARTIAPRPTALALLGAVGVALVALPVGALFWRAPWSEGWKIISSGETRTALRISLVCSATAALLSAVMGFPLAWLLARYRFPFRSFVRAITTLPVVLPPVVGGVALLMAFGRRGVVGQWLDRWFGITLPFTTLGAALAGTFVALPFFVLSMEAAIASLDRATEEAAAVAGASRWFVFRHLTIPALRTPLAAAAALCWARALGEFGATITFAGNVPGRSQTLPLVVYEAFEANPPAATVLSVFMLSVALAVLLALRGSWLPRLGAVAGSSAR